MIETCDDYEWLFVEMGDSPPIFSLVFGMNWDRNEPLTFLLFEDRNWLLVECWSLTLLTEDGSRDPVQIWQDLNAVDIDEFDIPADHMYGMGIFNSKEASDLYRKECGSGWTPTFVDDADHW